MLCKRLIACLDIREGKLAEAISPAGHGGTDDVLTAARLYYEQGIDELILYDQSAVSDEWGLPPALVEQISAQIFIPFSVMGRLRGIEDCVDLQRAGAEKINLNTAAATSPRMLRRIAKELYLQRAVLSIDAKKVPPTEFIPSGYEVFVYGGHIPTGLDAVQWARQGEELGAGEILINSLDAPAQGTGYDIPLTATIAAAVNVPVIASGGGTTLEHVHQILVQGGADAAQISPLLDHGETTVEQIKTYLTDRGLPMRRIISLG